MSQRGGGRPEEGTPEYDWLYGTGRGRSDDETQIIRTQGGPPPQDDGPDSTRVMPTVPREQPRQSAPRQQPAPPRRTPATPPPAAPATKRRRLGCGCLSLPALLVLLLLVYLVGVPLLAWSRTSHVDAMPEDKGRPDDQGGTTYLVVGSDSRGDLSDEQKKDYGTGDVQGQRTDTIMVLHTGSGPNVLMSIPRDSIVDVPGHGETKINSSYAWGGPQLLIQTVEQNTGIRIDHYVEIGFGGFVDLVDAVGGIEICPKQAMQDKRANLDIKKGCQEVDGATALGYARSRHTSNLGDIDRARHQREVVSAIGDKVLSPWTVINPLRYWKVNSGAAGSLVVDQDTGPIDIGRFGWAMTHVNGDSGLTCSVPISDLAVHWDPERSKQMFDLIAEDRTEDIGKDLCTPTGLQQ